MIEEFLVSVLISLPNHLRGIIKSLAEVRSVPPTFISHVAMTTNTGQFKVGFSLRGERLVKWNKASRFQRALETLHL